MEAKARKEREGKRVRCIGFPGLANLHSFRVGAGSGGAEASHQAYAAFG